ncbi:MAG TPA: DUF4191 domain-containing protein [Actinomycetes bacterium]|nr:DUF4191 domain-containing protein [Actinomycetes bacterium]
MALWNRKKKAAEDPTEPSKPGRLAQIKQTYDITKKSDPKILWILIGSLLGPFVLLLGIGYLVGYMVIFGFLGFMTGLTLAAWIFGRRAERAVYGQIEGQPGAAAASLNMLRRGWTVTPAVAFTKQQDLVHRVVGRSGVVLVGEGNHNRVRGLLNQEKRKVARVAPDISVHEIFSGNGDDEVPLRKLPRAVTKLPKSITPGQVNELNHRLKALTAQQGAMPIPKGPMPRSAKQARSMRG